MSAAVYEYLMLNSNICDHVYQVSIKPLTHEQAKERCQKDKVKSKTQQSYNPKARHTHTLKKP